VLVLKRFFLVAALLLTSFPAWAGPLRVVTSFSILADMTKAIGGDAVIVTSLVGPNADAHAYQPTPEDAGALAKADLIIINGLGLEGWMARLTEASGTRANVIIATVGVHPRMLSATTPDPHAWQDLALGRVYVKNIAAALEQAAPGKAAAIKERAGAYDAQLADMDNFTHAQFADIPPMQRKIITSHNAFGYFAASYNVTFLAPIGISDDAEPSAADVAKLIEQIKSEGIKRIFIENMTNPRLIEQIGKDTGAKLGGTLYSDALSATDGPAPTYLAMFQNNVPLLRAAMLLNRP
jgi:zinc/manganese transport system substrate-binding protein